MARQNTMTPHSNEAEKSVLGAIFLENDCLRQVSGMVDGTDFYAEANRKIFWAMLSCRVKNSPIDLVTMTKTLTDSDDIHTIGGAPYLAELIDFVPTSTNVIHYCRIVKELSVKRQLIEYSGKLSALAYSGESVVEGLKQAKDELKSIESCLDSFGGVNIADISTMEQRANRYAKHVQTLDNSRFVTGYSILDGYIRGVAPGEVMQIVAYSGTFKTAFLQNLLLNGASRTGMFHLFFSLEMPIEKVFERELQIASGESGWTVENAWKRKGEQAKNIMTALYRSGGMGLLVCEKPRLNLDKIARYIELAGNKFGKINAVGIDYMGLMDAPGKSLFEKTAYISAETKNLAKEMSLPIIMLCQINRDSARNQKEVESYSAKGGGDIEAGADFMLGFYTEEENLICKILKNRNGPAGKRFLVDIDRASFQFVGMSEYEPERKPKITRAV